MAAGMLVNDEQIRRAWEGLLTSEIRAAYFGDLVGRMNRIQRYGTWLTLLLSSGGVASLLLSLPDRYVWIRFALPVMSAVVSLWLLTHQYPKLAIESADLHLRWSKLANEYRKLWENVYVDSALDTLNSLDDRAADASKAGTSLPYDPKIMLAWEEHVLSHRHLTAER